MYLYAIDFLHHSPSCFQVKPIADVSTETKLQFCPTSIVNFTLSKYTNWKSLRNKKMYRYVHYVQHPSACAASEVEKVDEILWREGLCAALWVIGCAGVVCVLPEKDVAMCAEVQGVTVLLSARIAAAQLEVHLLPLQVAFV